MNKYIFILCLFSVGINVIQCMEPEMPKQYNDLDWKAAVRELAKNKDELAEEEYKRNLDYVLEYAVDRYEQLKGKPEDREQTKQRLFRHAIKDS